MALSRHVESSVKTAAKIAGAILVVVALLFAAREAGDHVPAFARWVDGLGLWGPVVFILGYAMATVALIPGAILTLVAGAIFGLLEGVIYVFVAATLGAVAAFLVARYLARGLVERKLADYPRFQKVDAAVGEHGRKIVFLLRLSPVFPFVLLNYGLGLTKVRLADYTLACLGMIPGTLLYVYYGKVVGDIAAVAGGAAPERGVGYWVVLGLGLAATVAVTTVVTRIARRALAEETDAEILEEPDDESDAESDAG